VGAVALIWRSEAGQGRAVAQGSTSRATDFVVETGQLDGQLPSSVASTELGVVVVVVVVQGDCAMNARNPKAAS